MDRVRFGRALGYGARHAAKSLMNAAEAASAPNPSRPTSGAATTPASRPPSAASRSAAGPATPRVIQTPRNLAATKTHARALGRSVWSPLARFSSVIWLQVTGTFFALLALFLSEGLWKDRGNLRLPISSHIGEQYYVRLAACAIFTYFAISNFVRAHRRDRR